MLQPVLMHREAVFVVIEGGFGCVNDELDSNGASRGFSWPRAVGPSAR